MNQLNLFNPFTFESNNNWGYQIYSQGDRIYHTDNCRLGYVSQVSPEGRIRISWDDGENGVVDHTKITPVKTSGFGFKKGDRVRIKLNPSKEGTVKEIAGNCVLVDWDFPDDSVTYPEWIEKI